MTVGLRARQRPRHGTPADPASDRRVACHPDQWGRPVTAVEEGGLRNLAEEGEVPRPVGSAAKSPRDPARTTLAPAGVTQVCARGNGSTGADHSPCAGVAVGTSLVASILTSDRLVGVSLHSPDIRDLLTHVGAQAAGGRRSRSRSACREKPSARGARAAAEAAQASGAAATRPRPRGRSGVSMALGGGPPRTAGRRVRYSRIIWAFIACSRRALSASVSTGRCTSRVTPPKPPVKAKGAW